MEEEVLFKIEIEGVQVGIKNIEDLNKASKALRDERKQLNLTTDEGKKRVAEINAQLDKNTQIIKENSSAVEKQRMNVGNYVGALDKLIPGLGATATGFEAMTAAARTFLLTPIGAVIGALGLAIGALTAYFKGSEEGQDSWGRAMQVGKVIFQQLTVIVENLGKVVFKTLDVLFTGFEKALAFVAPTVAASLDAIKKAGVDIAKLEEEIGDLEDSLIVQRANTAKKVAEIRSNAIKLEGKQKREAIEQAIKLEEDLAEKEVELAKKQLEFFKADQKSRGAITGEEKTRIAELEAEVIDAEASKYQATLRFTKELEKLNDESAKKKEKLNDEEIKRLNELSNAQFEAEMRAIDILNKKNEEYRKAQDELTKLIEKVNEYGLAVDMSSALSEAEADSREEQTKANQDYTNETIRAAKAQAEQDRNVNMLSASLGNLGGAMRAGTQAQKTFSSAQALINTYLGATNVLTAKPPLPFPLNILALGATIASGLATVARINATPGFASGGLTGTKIMSHHGSPINRSNGDNRLVTVRTGEVILNERQQAALGGSRTFSRIGVPGFASGGFVGSVSRESESNMFLSSVMTALRETPIYVAVEDINKGQMRYSKVVDTANVI